MSRFHNAAFAALFTSFGFAAHAQNAIIGAAEMYELGTRVGTALRCKSINEYDAYLIFDRVDNLAKVQRNEMDMEPLRLALTEASRRARSTIPVKGSCEQSVQRLEQQLLAMSAPATRGDVPASADKAKKVVK